jgi:hypothetical protein
MRFSKWHIMAVNVSVVTAFTLEIVHNVSFPLVARAPQSWTCE